MANTKILYLECEKRNVVDKYLLKKQGHWLRGEDGRIEYNRRMHPNPPWIYTKPRENQNCHYWHKILFDEFFGQKKIPVPCHECWKVVLMPRNLEELIATYIMQLYLGRACKCGTEGDRENTNRLYGGYFYNHSLEDGKECYRLVKKAMEDKKEWERVMFGCPIKAKFYTEGDVMPYAQGDIIIKSLPNLILKRGCTEYEQNVGPSDKWAYNQDQVEEEYILGDSFVQDHPNFRQSDHQIATVFQSWIHNAFRWGDLSYKKFTNGNQLYTGPVTYHEDKPGGKKDGKKRT